MRALFAAAFILALMLVPVKANAAQSSSPRLAYILNCQGCHLPDGSGVAGKVPTLRGELGKFLWVKGGREYIVQVPGTRDSKLSDAMTATLLNWLIVKMGPKPPPDFRPYSASEVTRIRVNPLRNAAHTRAELMKEIEQLANNKQ